MLLLLEALTGAAAGAVAFLLVRRFVPAPWAKIAAVIFIALGLAAARVFVAPMLEERQRENDWQAMVEGDAVLALLLNDQPQLRAPMREAVMKSLKVGDRETATATVRGLLVQIFPKYIGRASDESVRGFVGAMVTTLKTMEPARCYEYLRPQPGRAVVLGVKEGRDQLLDAIRQVLESAIQRPRNAPVEEPGKLLDQLVDGLRQTHGEEMGVLQAAQIPPASQPAFCRITIDLYQRVLALPPENSARLLRGLMPQ